MNYFEILSSGAPGREARLTAIGAATLSNRLHRDVTEIELLNVRRKARIAAWNEDMLNSGKAFDDDEGAVLENNATGIFIPLPEEKISNRFMMPSDGWIHVASLGEHPHPRGLVQVISPGAVNAMVQNFRKEKAADPDHALLVDRDHVSQTGSTEAAGWITNLEARQNGLWANIAWTNSGKDDVENGRYRSVSPVWTRASCVPVAGKPDNYCSPVLLDSLGLTNNANLSGLTPITKIV